MEDSHAKKMHMFIYAFLVVALLGLADAAYLAAAYYTGTPLSCGIIDGCNEVAQSEYAYIAGISLPTIGIIYYVFTVFNILFYMLRRTNYAVTVLSFLTTLGLLASLYFVYLQLYVIGAVCVYCMFSAVSATVLFALSILIRRHHLRKHPPALV